MIHSIIKFDYEYYFLDNFYPCTIEYDGRIWTSSEHAFQVMKSEDRKIQNQIRNYKLPGMAKARGQEIDIREDWDKIKFGIMKNILIKKFEIGSELAKKLMETGDALLVEGNTWRDNIWGVCYCDKCKGYGHNALGEILMKIRTDLLTYG